MEKILFDSHAHISDEAYKEDYAEFIASVQSSAVRYCMDIGTSLATSRDCIESAAKYSFCYAAIGVHPSEVSELTQESAELCLSQYLSNPKVVAIGEIGLDYHFEDAPSKELQRKWFKYQLKWAIEHKAPVCIHSRDADEECLNILKECGAFSKERAADFPPKPNGKADCRILLHCFSGSSELARQYISLGATISLAGPVSFKNARRPKEVARDVELSDLLIETDSPYMAPEPVRGTRNTPVNVEHVARAIADIKNISYEEVAKTCLRNACRFYGIDCAEEV